MNKFVKGTSLGDKVKIFLEPIKCNILQFWKSWISFLLFDKWFFFCDISTYGDKKITIMSGDDFIKENIKWVKKFNCCKHFNELFTFLNIIISLCIWNWYVDFWFTKEVKDWRLIYFIFDYEIFYLFIYESFIYTTFIFFWKKE